MAAVVGRSRRPRTLLARLGPFTLYHYGRYDRRLLDHMTGRYGVPPGAKALVKRLKSEAVDVLAVVSGSVYFPTHSPSLKAIGTFLGVIWSDPVASGIQSLLWRHQWERTGDVALKESLLRYNSDDCSALRRLTDVLDGLTRGTTAGAMAVVHPDEVLAHPARRFGPVKPATPAIGRIIETAYFKYQTTKVFFRTDPALRQSLRRSKMRRRSFRVNKVVAGDKVIHWQGLLDKLLDKANQDGDDLVERTRVRLETARDRWEAVASPAQVNQIVADFVGASVVTVRGDLLAVGQTKSPVHGVSVHGAIGGS